MDASLGHRTSAPLDGLKTVDCGLANAETFLFRVSAPFSEAPMIPKLSACSICHIASPRHDARCRRVRGCITELRRTSTEESASIRGTRARLHHRATMLNTASWTYEASSDQKPRLSKHEPARFPNVGSKFALGCAAVRSAFYFETQRRIETRPWMLSCSLRRHAPRSTCVRSLLPIPC